VSSSYFILKKKCEHSNSIDRSVSISKQPKLHSPSLH